jgi:hypothetical protein
MRDEPTSAHRRGLIRTGYAAAHSNVSSKE